MIGEPGGVAERRPGGERQRERRDDGIAGTGDVRDLVGSDDRNVVGRPAGLEQRHATAAARDEHGAALQPPEQRATGRSSTPRIVVDLDAEQRLDLGLVRRARGHAR